MEHKTWTTADKTGWGPGPWQDEPDKEQWADAATGYPCLIVRGYMGGLCGYVGVPPGHPWYEQSHADVDAAGHGPLTHSGHCQPGPEAVTICHVPGPGEDDRVWWLGFDCGHGWDVQPAMTAMLAAIGYDTPELLQAMTEGIPGTAYRDIGYVRGCCASLARQAADAAR